MRQRLLEVDNTTTSYHVCLSDKDELDCQVLDFTYLDEAKEAAKRLEFYLHSKYAVDLYQRKEKAIFNEEGEFSHLELVGQRKLIF